MNCIHGDDQGFCHTCMDIAEDNAIKRARNEESRREEEARYSNSSNSDAKFERAQDIWRNAKRRASPAEIILNEFKSEVKRGYPNSWGGSVCHNPEHGLYRYDHLFNIKKHNLIIHGLNYDIEVYIVVPSKNKSEGQYRFNLPGIGTDRYIWITKNSELQFVYDSDWNSSRSDMDKKHQGFIDGPWWDCLKDIIIPELRAFNDLEEEKERKKNADEKRAKENHERTNLRSWKSNKE